MKRKKHGTDEIIRKLREAEVLEGQGQTVAAVCQKLEISEQTLLRDECLDREAFMDLREAMVVIEDYRRFYRDDRPHSSLDYRTPGSFALLCRGAAG